MCNGLKKKKNSFSVMANSNPTITIDQLKTHPLTDDDVYYLMQNMDGDPDFNYNAYVDNQFTRYS